MSFMKKKKNLDDLQKELAKEEGKNFAQFKKTEELKKKIAEKKAQEEEDLSMPPPPEEEKKPEKKGLISRMDKIEEMLDETAGKKKKKDRSFKFPLGVRGKAKRAAKNNQYLVLSLHENATASFDVRQIEDGAFQTKDKVPHPAHKGFTYHMKYKKHFVPLVIQPTWSILPEPTKDYAETIGKKEDGIAAKFIIQWIARTKVEGEKKRMSAMQLVMWVVGIGVGAYVLFGSSLTGG